jgi:hypothetical protein
MGPVWGTAAPGFGRKFPEKILFRVGENSFLISVGYDGEGGE